MDYNNMKEEMIDFLKEQFGSEAEDFDMEEAIYWFANNYYIRSANNATVKRLTHHKGQSLYGILITSDFRPGPFSNGPEQDSMCEMMYYALVDRFAPDSDSDGGIKESSDSQCDHGIEYLDFEGHLGIETTDSFKTSFSVQVEGSCPTCGKVVYEDECIFPYEFEVPSELSRKYGDVNSGNLEIDLNDAFVNINAYSSGKLQIDFEGSIDYEYQSDQRYDERGALVDNEDIESGTIEFSGTEDFELDQGPVKEGQEDFEGSKMNEGSEGGSGEMEKKIEYALDSIERMADVQHMAIGTRFGFGFDQGVLNMPVSGTSRNLGEQITFCYNGIRTLKNLVNRGESAQQISNRMNDSVFKDMYWPIGADEEGVNSFLEAIEQGLVKYRATPDDIKKIIGHLNWAIENANRHLSSICESCGPIKEGEEDHLSDEEKCLNCGTVDPKDEIEGGLCIHCFRGMPTDEWMLPSSSKTVPLGGKKGWEPKIGESDEGDEGDEEETEEGEGESEPVPEDYTMTPSGRLGGRTAVAQVEGKFLGEFDSDQEAIDFIKRRMEKEQYWPAVWYISDHGNISPVTINFNS